jgi:predicted DNA-binding transcriptional regulator AlpA
MALATNAILGGIDNRRDLTGKDEETEPTLVACVVFRTRDPEQLVELLREALTGIAAPDSAVLTASQVFQPQPDPEDPWLKHAEAAVYLGISRSTLYQYACQQRVECRKLAGRLEYRRSTLDQFKDQQIRPARRQFLQRRIISAAPSSGK